MTDETRLHVARAVVDTIPTAAEPIYPRRLAGKIYGEIIGGGGEHTQTALAELYALAGYPTGATVREYRDFFRRKAAKGGPLAGFWAARFDGVTR